VRILLRFALGATALCLIGSVAALLAGVGRVDDPLPLRFDPDPFVIPLSAVWPGQNDFEVDVVNSSSEAARIIGAEDYCGSACFSGKGLPAVIPARGRGRVTVSVKARASGLISSELHFFTDRPTQPKLTMRIEGYIPEGAKGDLSTRPGDPGS